TIRASSESVEEARRKITRRGVAPKSGSGWVGTAASIIVLVGIAAGGYYLYDKHEKSAREKADAKAAADYKGTEKVREAEAEYKKFAKAAEADPVEDSIITEAAAKAEI